MRRVWHEHWEIQAPACTLKRRPLQTQLLTFQPAAAASGGLRRCRSQNMGFSPADLKMRNLKRQRGST